MNRRPFVFSRYRTVCLWMQAVLFAGMYLSVADGALAQTIRDEVKDHVEQSLAKEKEKARKKRNDDDKPAPEKAEPDGNKPSASPSKEPDKPPPENGVHFELSTADRRSAPDEADLSTKPKSKMPYRVINKNFKLDLRAGVGYRGWLPQPYPAVAVDPANYFTWSVGASAKFFNVVRLTKMRYESNNAATPRKSYVAGAAKYGSYALKAAWFLAELGVEALQNVEPTIRYESRAFLTTARADEGTEVCIVPFNQDADVEGCRTDEKAMTLTSSMETAALGVKLHPKGGSKVLINGEPGRTPSIFLGGGYLSYLKPYQVTVGEYTLDEYLFTGRFYGGGLAFGLAFGGGINRPYLDSWLQLGLGRVRLTKDMTLNELAPDDWLIGYLQGNLRFSFQWAPFKFAPTILIIPSGTVSGAGFFFFETEVDEGEETAMPGINWDLLYTVRLALVITL